MQNIFSNKVSVTLPIHTVLEVAMNKKDAVLIDVSEKGQLCFLDNDNYLNVVRKNIKKIDCIKTDSKKKIVGLKWIG